MARPTKTARRPPQPLVRGRPHLPVLRRSRGMTMIKSRPRHVTGAIVAGALLAAGIAVSAAAAAAAAAAFATPDLQGVWKLAAPTKTLKPVSGSVPFTAQGDRKRVG